MPVEKDTAKEHYTVTLVLDRFKLADYLKNLKTTEPGTQLVRPGKDGIPL
jgi:hypothetical protein